MVKIKKQKVRFRKKKREPASPKKKPQRFRIRLKDMGKFLVTILVVGGIGFGFVSLKYMFVDAGYFMIKGVDIKLYDEKGTLQNISLDEVFDEDIVGTNIFFLDLNKLKERIELLHPEFKGILIRRLLPNKLIVQGSLRKAIAQIRSDRYYLVDDEGVLLPNIKNFPDRQLPIITGIGINLAKASRADFSEFEKDKLDKALEVINEASANESLSGYKLKVVDVTDPGNVSFFLTSANIEIKIGNSDFQNRLEVLSTVLEQMNSDIDSFKYIDLRFEDPIIGPR